MAQERGARSAKKMPSNQIHKTVYFNLRDVADKILYDHINSGEIRNFSGYVKKLIYDDMQKRKESSNPYDFVSIKADEKSMSNNDSSNGIDNALMEEIRKMLADKSNVTDSNAPEETNSESIEIPKDDKTENESEGILVTVKDEVNDVESDTDTEVNPDSNMSEKASNFLSGWGIKK